MKMLLASPANDGGRVESTLRTRRLALRELVVRRISVLRSACAPMTTLAVKPTANIASSTVQPQTMAMARARTGPCAAAIASAPLSCAARLVCTSTEVSAASRRLATLSCCFHQSRTGNGRRVMMAQETTIRVPAVTHPRATAPGGDNGLHAAGKSASTKSVSMSSCRIQVADGLYVLPAKCHSTWCPCKLALSSSSDRWQPGVAWRTHPAATRR